MGFIDKMRNKFMMGRGRAKQDAGRAMKKPRRLDQSTDISSRFLGDRQHSSVGI